MTENKNSDILVLDMDTNARLHLLITILLSYKMKDSAHEVRWALYRVAEWLDISRIGTGKPEAIPMCSTIPILAHSSLLDDVSFVTGIDTLTIHKKVMELLQNGRV